MVAVPWHVPYSVRGLKSSAKLYLAKLSFVSIERVMLKSTLCHGISSRLLTLTGLGLLAVFVYEMLLVPSQYFRMGCGMLDLYALLSFVR